MALARLAAAPPETLRPGAAAAGSAAARRARHGRAAPMLAAQAKDCSASWQRWRRCAPRSQAARAHQGSEKLALAAEGARIAKLIAAKAASAAASRSEDAARKQALALARQAPICAISSTARGRPRQGGRRAGRGRADSQGRGRAAQDGATPSGQGGGQRHRREAAAAAASPPADPRPSHRQTAVAVTAPRRGKTLPCRHIRPFAQAKGAMVSGHRQAGRAIWRRRRYGRPARGLTWRPGPGRRRRAVRRAGAVRRAVPRLRANLDHRTWRRISFAVGGLGPARRSVGQWLVAGEPVGRMPTKARQAAPLSRAAPRRPADQPVAVAGDTR